jgi:hypothetical protein
MRFDPIWWWLGGAGLVGVILATRKAEAQPADTQEDADSDAAATILQVSVNVSGPRPSKPNMILLAKALREELPGACPGAPILNKTLKRNVVTVEGGNRIVYTFDATFAGAFDEANPFVKKQVADCMFAFVKQTSRFGARVVGIRAERIA